MWFQCGKTAFSFFLVVLLLHVQATKSSEFMETALSRPIRAEGAPDIHQEPTDPVTAAGVTPCAPGQDDVWKCIDSGMQLSSTNGYIPPDPHGAAGPYVLCAVTNVHIECLQNDNAASPGTVIFSVSLYEMFASFKPEFLYDPKILYDVHRSRFVLVVLDAPSDRAGIIVRSNIRVAVSITSYPLGFKADDWYFASLPSLIENTWTDYPGIAVDEEALYITANMFTATKPYKYVRGLVWIVDKTALYVGGAPSYNAYDYYQKAGKTYPEGTHMPAMVRSSTGVPNNVGTYLVMYDGLTDDILEYIQVVEIKNPLGDVTFQAAQIVVGDIDVTSTSLLNAPQAGSSARISTNDKRALDAVWVKNTLWFVATVAKAAGEATAYWFKVKADGVSWPPFVLDHGEINGELIQAGAYTYMASLDVNEENVAMFGFAASSPTMYGSAYATFRDDKMDPSGTVRVPEIVKLGLAPYYITFGGTRNRWGDYSGMALDPLYPDCFWAFNQYAGPKNYTTYLGEWKTAWAKLCYMPGPSSPPALAPTKAPIKDPPTMAPAILNRYEPPVAPTLGPTQVPTLAPTLVPTLVPSLAPTKACIKLKKRCNPKLASTVCCKPDKNVCRKAAGKYSCLPCLAKGTACKVAEANACCSKKCGKVQGKTGSFCKK